MRVYGKTDTGKKRIENQDRFLAKELLPGLALLVVCDGMGGENGGYAASTLALKTFEESVTGCITENYDTENRCMLCKSNIILDCMRSSAVAANKAVFERASNDDLLEGMGTTLAAAIITSDILYCLNVGDSRTYLVSSNKFIRRISKDHSYVQHLVDLGRMTPEEAKYSLDNNLITRAIGVSETVEPDTFTAICENSRILICSDGLTAHLDDSAIGKILGDYTISPEDAVDTLIVLANEGGGIDNITAVLADNFENHVSGGDSDV